MQPEHEKHEHVRSSVFTYLRSKHLNVYDYYYLPCLATITEETASGTLVPAAKNVIPITESGMFNVLPIELRKFYANDKDKLNVNQLNINCADVCLLSNWCSDFSKIKFPPFPFNRTNAC